MPCVGSPLYFYCMYKAETSLNKQTRNTFTLHMWGFVNAALLVYALQTAWGFASFLGFVNCYICAVTSYITGRKTRLKKTRPKRTRLKTTSCLAGFSPAA